MQTDFQTLSGHSINDHMVVLSFARPESANALNMRMALDIKGFFESLKATEFRAVIITGAGRHFCAGADLKERKGMNEAQWKAQHDAFEDALQALLACEIPVIAAVNGAAFGGGLEIALACDFIYASEEARFALTETTLGIIPGMGGTQHLPRRIGMARAKELIFLGRAFSAAEALHMGVVNRLCAPAALMDEVTACANTICANGPLAVKAAKKAINEGFALPIHGGLERELLHYNKLLASKDRVEGVTAFNEKRKPAFTGE